jgi:hypothetical protein
MPCWTREHNYVLVPLYVEYVFHPYGRHTPTRDTHTKGDQKLGYVSRRCEIRDTSVCTCTYYINVPQMKCGGLGIAARACQARDTLSVKSCFTSPS